MTVKQLAGVVQKFMAEKPGNARKHVRVVTQRESEQHRLDAVILETCGGDILLNTSGSKIKLPLYEQVNYTYGG